MPNSTPNLLAIYQIPISGCAKRGRKDIFRTFR
jgi:hypothetical protein